MPKLHVTRPRREHRSLHHAAILAPRRGHLAWVERDGWRTNKCLFFPAPISFAAAVAAIRRLTTSTAAATCRADSLSVGDRFSFCVSGFSVFIPMPDARAAAIHARHTRTNNNNILRTQRHTSCLPKAARSQHASPELPRARRARESAIRRYEKLEHMLGKLNA